ncbi:hypothetical protein [Tatumella sp. OPLPL6]|uniref:hypothetical protein n=1 Tax=Tatumella sp. OPLPL6 TaxID=1928657 RepID=UPI000C184FB7|nr:hypothetical protein [Tatumella sp. OPLPL6]PIJ42643.1 hypothetical protein BOM24_12425 [Tatumella sp. OPLPL6]
MDNGSITFFDITACGFYRLKRNPEELDYKFGDISIVLDDLEQWLEGKNFEETLPWNKDEQPLKVRVYSRGLARDEETQDAVIVLYREVGNGNGIHGIKIGTKVGSDSKGTVRAGNESGRDKVIWGEPCYYWIIPELNKVASIRFPHSYADGWLFTQYFTQHINNNSKLGTRTRTKRTYESAQMPGRSVDTFMTLFKHQEGKKKVNCLFKFNIKETKLKAAEENFERMRDKITHTLIKDITNINVADTRQPLLKLTSNVLASLIGKENRDKMIGQPPLVKQSRKIEVKIDGAPSSEELKSLFLMRGNEDSAWDVGFLLSDRANPVWLSTYVARTKLPLNNSDGFEHYSAKFLLEEIKKIRGDLIEEIQNSEKASLNEHEASLPKLNAEG